MATNFSDIRKHHLGSVVSIIASMDHFHTFTLDLGLKGTTSFSSEGDCDIMRNIQIIGVKNHA